MDKSILGVIPARGGSKGVPRKNIKNLRGKPLLAYVYEAARRSKYISKLILSTEDEEIASVGKDLGLEVPFMRPRELATDTATSISFVRHALDYFDRLGFRADAVISVQPTNPFTKTETIDDMIRLWAETGCESVTTISLVTVGHPYITKRLKEGNVIENFVPIPEGLTFRGRQDREKAYYLTGGIYLRSRSLIQANDTDNHQLGRDSRAIVVDEIEAIDINTPFDFEFAEWMMVRESVEV